jgi:exosome complex component RRP40
LSVIGEIYPFEIATGMNGRIWINASKPKTIITIMNCIKNSEFTSGKETKAMVKGLVKAMNGDDE